MLPGSSNVYGGVVVRLLIAGGGTGGHLFPGVAVAEALKERDGGAEVLFVGTQRGIEARVLAPAGWELATIDVSGIKTVGLRGAVRGLLSVPKALWQSRRIIKEFRPDVVIGVGGYASGPAVLAARFMGRPTAILEQNSVPGLTNKILGKVVHSVFLAFDSTRRFFADRKIVMTGSPIRQQILSRLLAARDGDGATKDAGLHLFVFGGSQGAVAVNTLVVEAVSALRNAGRDVTIVHQTGPRDLDRVTALYRDAGLPPDADQGIEVRAFIDDMASEYRRADLVVARSGAGTVSELAVVGVPAILVPYPSAADNHQEVNAAEMVEGGAALLCRQAEATGAALAERIAGLMDEPAALGRMRNAMKARGRPQAGDDIVAWCCSQLPAGGAESQSGAR